MKIPTQKEFVNYIKDHLEETGEKPSSFGRRVLNDAGALSRLYGGTNPRLSTMNDIAAAIKEVTGVEVDDVISD